MRPCWLRGYERREVLCSPFAALIKCEEDPDNLCVGMLVSGLLPWERRLMNACIDDGFGLTDAVVQALDEPDVDIECTTYLWLVDKFPHAVGPEDWDQLNFNLDHEDDFTSFCKDMCVDHMNSKMTDDELKQAALQRRRNETGFEAEDEEDWNAIEAEVDGQEGEEQ